MSREKSIFEQISGTYTEKDGILYPNIRVGQEETEAERDTFSGKYGDLWKKYLRQIKLQGNLHINSFGVRDMR